MTHSLTIQPGRPLRGVIGPGGRYALPGDKSLSHRAALFAALATGESRIENFLVSGVTEAMLRALTALGVAWRLDGSTLIVQGRGLAGLRSPAAPLDCGNSATTLRLLVGALAAAGVAAEVTGSEGLRRRPMGRVVEPLAQMGVPVEATPKGTAPLRLLVRQGRLRGVDYRLPVASAQVKTALILAALAADRPTTLREPGPSRDHTERMLRSMGASIESWVEDDSIYVTQVNPSESWPPALQPLVLRLPCDISSAAFLLVAALVAPGSELTIQGVGLNPTRTGLVEALQRMGAELQVCPGPDQGGEPSGDLTVRTSALHGIEISGSQVVRMIDEFPAFAIAAAYASGETRVRDAQELRFKESDRISALAGELRKLGVNIQETPDGFILQGGRPLLGGQVDPHGDHRLAMSLALAGLAAQGSVTIAGAEIISESFPEFVPILTALGGTTSG
jgi:3-phosphoshikimate 1-carboxyvinyltransferase